jgi:hypothetical protein
MAVNGSTAGAIDLNDGTIELLAGRDTFDNTGCAFSMIQPHGDADTANTTENRAVLTVNGGQMLLTNGIFRVGPKNAGYRGSATVTLNGGLVAAKRIYVDAGLTNKVFNFNGGTFRFTAESGAAFNGAGRAATGFNVLAGGAKFDVPAGDLALGGIALSGSGPVVKLGAGTLALDSVWNGRVRVFGGTLRIAGAASSSVPAVQLASGTGLSLADGAAATFAPASLALPASGSFALALDPGDCLALPAGTPPFSASVTLTDPGAIGTFAVLTYSDIAPDVARLAVANPAPGRAY